MAIDQKRRLRLVWDAFWKTRDEAPGPDDNQYWTVERWDGMYERGHQLEGVVRSLNKNDNWQSPSDDPGIMYVWGRLIGWQAGDEDKPQFGPYGKTGEGFRPSKPYPPELSDKQEPENPPASGGGGTDTGSGGGTGSGNKDGFDVIADKLDEVVFVLKDIADSLKKMSEGFL